MATLIRELIDLPEQVHRGDFVLRLTEGVEKPRETLRDYVVTPQLAGCFDDALRFIKSAIEGRTSKAAYLHGSFGSGKSHFMAVLHLLLKNDAGARGLTELADVVARHSTWTEGRRFLLVPYHMIGARSMESAILGHYVAYVRQLHPEAPLPGVFKAESLFADAERLRTNLGDEGFFSQLNSQGGATTGWGSVAAAWDATSFGDAQRQAPGQELRTRLVGDLVQTFFTSYAEVVQGQDEAYVSLDVGLAAISRHAQALGYDAVVLFLDELILWLASHAADLNFVNREGQKLAQLVEAQQAHRPVPVVSFVARQRDLRELVGAHVTGAEDLAFADVLGWWEARFHTITLEDRNLPAIAEKRVLRPRSEAARIELDEAFRGATAVRQEVMDTLLTSTADREMFRQVYPFSPALVQALVAVSSALQRERTALKVMLQLLVEQRETLALGDLVAVGDLFDVIADGDEAFTQGMRVHFENARTLYARKLRPALLQENGLTASEVESLAADDPRRRRFLADDRLVKTLLLAALVPEVEAFRALTPGRLAALNHGSIRTPIPGGEAREVLRRVRQWAASVGEVKISGDDNNPAIAIQITGVDTEGIIQQARGEDNAGNRKRVLKELIFTEMGIERWDSLFIPHRFQWRGTDRQCEVVFGNVREMPDESLRALPGQWRVIIDYPFDEAGYTPKDDLARLDNFRREGHDARTLVWIPAFFTPDAQRDLGTLVVLDHILSGERFNNYSGNLPPVERATAKQLLQNQRDSLKQRIRLFLESAYGVREPMPGAIDTAHELADYFQSLDGGCRVQPPAAGTLSGGLADLLAQALTSQYPAHPTFEVPVKVASLRKLLPVLTEAAQAEDGRVFVDRQLRELVRGIAQPLKLGEMGETHFVLGRTWSTHFTRKQASEDRVTVARLRRWMDEPEPRGLPEEIQNLLILVWAELQHLGFVFNGGPTGASLESMRDELELQAQRLPDRDTWLAAKRRAESILGLTASELLNAPNVGKLASEIRTKVDPLRTPVNALVQHLERAQIAFGLAPGDTRRMRTAKAGQALVERVIAAQTEGIIEAVATATVATSEAAMARSLTRATDLAAALQSAAWDLFDAIHHLPEPRRQAADALRRRVAEALEADELAVNLATALQQAQRDAVALLADRAAPPPSVAGPADPPATGWRPVAEDVRVPAADASARLQRALDSLGTERLRRVFVSWSIEEKAEKD